MLVFVCFFTVWSLMSGLWVEQTVQESDPGQVSFHFHSSEQGNGLRLPAAGEKEATKIKALN